MEDVRIIRALDSEGTSADAIAKIVGLANDSRVKELLAGKTYSRVR